jgi:hypothetical protein
VHSLRSRYRVLVSLCTQRSHTRCAQYMPSGTILHRMTTASRSTTRMSGTSSHPLETTSIRTAPSRVRWGPTLASSCTVAATRPSAPLALFSMNGRACASVVLATPCRQRPAFLWQRYVHHLHCRPNSCFPARCSAVVLLEVLRSTVFTSHGAHRCFFVFFFGGVGASPDQVVCNTCTGFECDGCLFDSVTTNWVAVRLATVPLFTVPYLHFF